MSKEGYVAAIFISDGKGLPMKEVETVQVLAGQGLVGDRYAEGSGAWSKPGETKRQVTLISQAAINSSNFGPEETRRNVVVTLSPQALNDLVGKRFNVGGIWMQGVEPCDPCDRPSKLVDKPGFKSQFTGRGGIRAEILTDGVLHEGMKVEEGWPVSK